MTSKPTHSTSPSAVMMRHHEGSRAKHPEHPEHPCFPECSVQAITSLAFLSHPNPPSLLHSFQQHPDGLRFWMSPSCLVLTNYSKPEEKWLTALEMRGVEIPVPLSHNGWGHMVVVHGRPQSYTGKRGHRRERMPNGRAGWEIHLLCNTGWMVVADNIFYET